MKHLGRRLISLLLVVVMSFSIFVVDASAWSYMTHINSADIILMNLLRSANENDGHAQVTVYAPYDDHSSEGAYTYTIPMEFQEAIFEYPDAFRAGALGPDFYPDIIIGQAYTHPYDKATGASSGDWITLLCDSVNSLPKDSVIRKKALSFTLGYMLHFCGDLFGHDFINTFSGGTFPSVYDVNYLDSLDENLNNLMSHMSTENYMDNLTNRRFYHGEETLGVEAPTTFVTDTLVLNGSINGGAALIFDNYGELPPHFEYLISWRTELYETANEWRDNMDPFSAFAASYLDYWIEDQDRAIYELVKTFDVIAARLVNEPNASTYDIVSEEVLEWGENYGIYITWVPDMIFDGIDVSFDVLEWIFDLLDTLLLDVIPEIEFDLWIEELIEEILLWVIGFPNLDDKLEEYGDRLEDPSVQLDHYDNLYQPADDQKNFEEFREYMDRYAREQSLLSGTSFEELVSGQDREILDRVTDSELEAFYNTMVMFNLVLMGPRNYNNFYRAVTGTRRALTDYQTTTAHLKASSLKLEITTADLLYAGTNDHIYAEAYLVRNGSKELLNSKLLDYSGHDDFEAGDVKTYTLELPSAVRVDQIEVVIRQEGTHTPDSEWMCESVNITPMHAGAELMSAIGVGGNYYMDSGCIWNLNFQEALALRSGGKNMDSSMTVTNLKLKVTTTGEYSGTDSDIYLTAGSIYDGSTSKILLDKPLENDFENGDEDIYNISISKYNHITGKTEGTPLEDLHLILENSGSDDWTIGNIRVTLYHGNLEITVPFSLGGKMLSTSSWNLDLMSNIKNYCAYPSFELSYETSLDDGLLNYVNSIDASAQWVDDENGLWRNAAARKNIFFQVFKGFRPGIEYSGTESISWLDPIDMQINFEKIWNGISSQRRDEVRDVSDLPEIVGDVTVSFINYSGDVVSSTTKSFSGTTVSFDGYTDAALSPGYYDVKVSYTADPDAPMYSDAEEIFKDALYVNGSATATVKKVEVLDIDTPMAGETPDHEGALGDPVRYQFAKYGTTGSGIVWYDPDFYPMSEEDTFVAGETYTLEIKLDQKKTPSGGAITTFDTNALEAYLNGTMVSPDAELTYVWDSLSVSPKNVYIYAEYTCGISDNVVNSVQVLDIELPYAGENPDYTATLGDPERYQFANYGMDGAGYYWLDSEGVPMFEDDEFVPGETYTLEIKLEQKKTDSGGPLTSFNTPVKAYLNGEPVSSEDVYGSSSTVYIYGKYVCKLRNSVVKTVRVNNIERPYAGETPDYQATLGDPLRYDFATKFGPDGAGYWWYDSDGNALSADDTFVLGETYTLEIKLSQKKANGLVLSTFDTSSFAAFVNNQAPTETYVNSSTAYIYMQYVCTPRDSVVDKIEVFDLKTPVAGERPDYLATLGNSDQYEFGPNYGPAKTGIVWTSDDDTLGEGDRFVAGQTYYLEIKLVQKKIGNHVMTTFDRSSLETYLNGAKVTDVMAKDDVVYIFAEYVCEGAPPAVAGTVSSGEVSVSVENFPEGVESASLIVAQYLNDRLVGLQTMTITEVGTYLFNNLTDEEGYTYKVFLLDDSTYAPFCEADEF